MTSNVAHLGTSSSDFTMNIGQCLAKKSFVFIEAAEFFDLIDDDGVDNGAIERFTGSWNDPRPSSTSFRKVMTP